MDAVSAAEPHRFRGGVDGVAAVTASFPLLPVMRRAWARRRAPTGRASDASEFFLVTGRLKLRHPRPRTIVQLCHRQGNSFHRYCSWQGSRLRTRLCAETAQTARHRQRERRWQRGSGVLSVRHNPQRADTNHWPPSTPAVFRLHFVECPRR